MGIRKFATTAAIAALLTAGWTANARAQFFYPGGWGGWGWGGWGGATAEGDIARGLGAFAAGAGVYNLNTAQANSINADTLTRWNQYWYEAQVNANRNQRERMARRQAATVKSVSDLETRLRESPTERDILQGDALNMAMEQINDPRVYTKALSSAKVKIGGELIRNIPFQYASQAISISVRQITDKGAPPILRTPPFDADRAAIKKLADETLAEAEEGNEIDQEKLKEIQDRLVELRNKFVATVKRSDPGFAEGDRFLKAAYGLTRMLESPAVDVLLSGIEKRPEATLAELFNFMGAFNLRFGPATTASQRQAYQTLWPLVDRVRDEVAMALAENTSPGQNNLNAPAEFFSGVEHEELMKKPAPLRPRGAPAPPAPDPSK